jgi:hypothetical protein
VMTISAKSGAALQENMGRYAEHLGEHPELSLADVCHTANTGRSHVEHRLAVVAATTEQLREKLAACGAGQDPVGVFQGHVDLTRRPEVVFLFTGQGGQYLNMGRAFYGRPPARPSGSEMELCAMQLPGRESRFREPPFTRMLDAVEQAAEVLERRLDLPYALSATAWERYFVLSWRAFCAAVTGSGRFIYSFRRGGHPSSPTRGLRFTLCRTPGLSRKSTADITDSRAKCWPTRS